jgi:hypothetical protein
MYGTPRKGKEKRKKRATNDMFMCVGRQKWYHPMQRNAKDRDKRSIKS